MWGAKNIPRSVWALGFVSLFMDASSELVHSLLPIFMVTTLGASITAVGVMEGVAEASSLIIKIFSGALSDRLHKRKLLALIGYSLSALSKPLFPLAHSVAWAFSARLIDRMGKGIRGAPRDALVGDLAPPSLRGACFGLCQSLDTVGGIIGPFMAMLFMIWFAGDIRAVLWVAMVPALLCVLTLTLGVHEPKQHHRLEAKTTIRWRDIRHVGKAYWQVVGVAGVLTLARFSDAFLILKAQAIGLPMAYTPAVMVVMCIVYALTAYPVGVWSDRINRHTVLLIGTVFLIAADMTLGAANTTYMLALGVSLWGLHMGFTQGLLSAMVTDTAPAELRGTAYGFFNLISGIAMLLSSVIAGSLWDVAGSATTFFTGAFFSVIALIGLLFLKRR
jgi:MFS family permease